MDTYEAIEKRYSVRAYEDRPVDQETLERILNAGRIAPSGRNDQAWKFVVTRDRPRIESLAEAAAQPWMAKAPVIIAVVSTDPEKIMHCDVPAGPVDCAIAIDHMTLAAVAEGLGTCWIGHFDQDASRQLLGVPASAKIIELLTLGYPTDPPRAKKRKALGEVVCYEQFH